MFSAVMRYRIKPGEADAFCRLWHETVFAHSSTLDGLLSMQLYRDEAGAYAFGIWRERECAEAFMRTGVFDTLMERAGTLLAGQPQQLEWELVDWCCSS